MRWILTLALVLVAAPVYAFPGWAVTNGNSCSTNCHTSSRPDDVSVDGQGLLNLDGQRNDGKLRGDLESYTVSPGDTVALTANIADGSDAYSVQLKRLEKDGVIGASGDTLAGYVADAGWVAQGPPATTYFTDTSFGTPWTGPMSLVYTLTLDLNTPLNVYDLEFAVAGKGADGNFYDDEHFLLNVVSGEGPPAVPEPTTFALAALAMLGLAFLRR